jgi:hypothetical protein
MTFLKPFFLTALFLVLSIVGNCQDKSSYYGFIDFDQIFPRDKLMGLDRLTPEEREKLKMHVLDLYNDANKDGLSKGQEMMFKFFEAKINEYIRSQDAIARESSLNNLNSPGRESKVRKGLALFLNGLASAGQGYLQAQNNQSLIPLTGSTAVGSAAKVIESRIDGDFNGFEHGNIYKLTNGQIWEQTEFRISVRVRVNPAVTIIASGGGYKMLVEGINESVEVKRLK